MFFGEAAAPRQALRSRKSGHRMFSRQHPAASKAAVPLLADRALAREHREFRRRRPINFPLPTRRPCRMS